MRRKRKLNLILITFIIVLALGLGYAYLTTTLSINGTADVDSNTWNVHWENVQVMNGSVSGSQVIQAPTISNQTTVSFHIRLKEPGEYYEFTIDAKNDGSIDAMIDEIVKTINGNTTIPTFLNYTVTYEDGFEVTKNQLLAANSKETYKVRIEYRTDINPGDLPNNSYSLDVDFETPYVQATPLATVVRPFKYYVGDTALIIGDPIPSEVTLYDTPEEAMTAFGYNIFLRLRIEDNILDSVSLGFLYNNRLEYVDMMNNMEDYEARLNQVKDIFGANNCHVGVYAEINNWCRESNVQYDMFYNSGCVPFSITIVEDDNHTNAGCGLHSFRTLCMKN